MTGPAGVQGAQDTLTVSVQTLERVVTSIQFKANWLRQHRSPDPIQQMQSDAILDLCDAVQQIQQAISTLPIIILPPVSAARAAAAAAASTTVKSTTALSAFKRP